MFIYDIYKKFMPQNKKVMPQSGDISTSVRQARSALTEEAIIQAAIASIEEAEDFKAVSSRQLSKKSGFSVGLLYRYFKSKDQLYANLWMYFIVRLHKSLIKKLEVFPNTGTLRQLMMLITEHYFDDLANRKRNRVVPLYRLYIQSSNEPENIAKPIDILIEPLMDIIQKNQSGTMRALDQNEIRVYLRAALAMVRSDFLEGNPFFGTQPHQRVILDALVRLFQK